jgi:pilus assembly protein CpaE
MLTALIIGVTPEITAQMSRLCGESADICVYKTFEPYPHLHEIVRLVNSYSPDVVFLQLWAEEGNQPEAERIRSMVEEIRMAGPEIALIGVLPNAGGDGVRMAAELGVVEFLVAPFAFEEFRDVIFRGLDRVAGPTKGDVYSFLPAKSGSGATVTALNVAESLARDFDRRVLLLEADIASGPLAIMLNIHPEQSVIDALECSDHLTNDTWRRMVTTMNGLDVLTASGAQAATPASQFSYFRLLSFAQQHYDDIIVDFPGAVADPAEPLLSHSKAIYVVCTPELTSLAMARRRLFQLELRGERDRTLAVVLNRCDQGDLSKEDMEQGIGRQIAEQLPNDYRAVQRAVASGGFVDPATELGKAYTAFAAHLAGSEPPHPKGSSRLRSLLRKFRPAGALSSAQGCSPRVGEIPHTHGAPHSIPRV